jgi:hypothetical protein
MATPTDNANHTSTKRVSWRAWRSFCIGEIMAQAKNQSRGTAIAGHTPVC